MRNHLQEARKELRYHFSNNESYIVLGDFNAKMLNSHMEEFCGVYKLENLV